MKKQIVTIITVILIAITAETITVYGAETESEDFLQELIEEMPEPDTEIIFDADAVKNKTAAKSALADMHGVFVFRSAFIKQEAIVKEAEKKSREAIENMVLTSVQPDLDYRQWVDLVLAADTQKFIKDVYMEEEESSIFIWIYCIILSICLLCAAIRIEDYLKKKHRKEEKKDNYEIYSS